MKSFPEALQASGLYTFSKEDVMDEYAISEGAARSLIRRRVKAGKAVHLRSGLYAVIPAEYLNSGAPPASWYIDSLLKHLNREYYVGLLSAASMHGASHHKSQILQVVVTHPERPVLAGRNTIRFYTSSRLALADKVSMKTPTGYMTVSSVEQTLIDLVLFINECGGSGNVITLISELVSEVKPKVISRLLARENTAVVQRVGFLLDETGFHKIADEAFKLLEEKTTRRIVLTPGKTRLEKKYSQRWKVYYPSELEPEA